MNLKLTPLPVLASRFWPSGAVNLASTDQIRLPGRRRLDGRTPEVAPALVRVQFIEAGRYTPTVTVAASIRFAPGLTPGR